MSILSKFRRIVVPAAIGVILFSAFAGYYLYWVPNRQRHLDDRSFRTLKTLGGQVQATIEAFDRMMDYAADLGITQDNLGDYLKYEVPQLQAPEKTASERLIGDDYDDPPKIAVAPDEGTHYLYLAFSHDSKRAFVVRTDLDKLITRLLGPATMNQFDVVLLAKSDGTVIFQKSSAGIEIAGLKELEDASGENGAKSKPEIKIDSLLETSRLLEVRIAGARYRLYSQPLQIPFSPASPDKKSRVEGVSSSWVLCGLVRADRFRAERQLIPYVYILMTLGAILLAVAAYPFLRLHFSAPGERLRAKDITLTAIFGCIVVAVLTFVLVDAYYWKISFDSTTVKDMQHLAEALNRNFEQEKALAFEQLGELGRNPSLLYALDQINPAAEAKVRLPFPSDVPGKCEPAWACRTSMLGDTDTLTFHTYPYLLFAYWSDSRGQQRVKWSTRKFPTPFVSLDETVAPFYADVRRALKNPAGAEPVPTEGIGTQYSSTTGQNITVFWKVFERNRQKYCGALVTQPVSVVNSVLPGGYQYAVIDRDGTVVYNSDPTRNLRENFFAETEQDPQLRSRVRMRAAGPVVADYLGHRHRIYVQPMTAKEDGSWTIVVFRDLHREEVMNVELISLVSIMFLLYCAIVAAVSLVLYLVRKERSTTDWLWPDSRKARGYAWISWLNAGAAVLLVFIGYFASPVALLAWTSFIPVATLVLNRVALTPQRDPGMADDDGVMTSSAKWQLGYFAASATLLVVIAVLPCLAFFKLACDFEQKLLIEHTQLELAADLDQRAGRIKTRYQDLRTGLYASAILAGAEDENAKDLLANQHRLSPAPLFSYHKFLANSVCRKQAQPLAASDPLNAASPDCSQPGNQDSNSFLSSITLPYNESTADDRHLSEGSSDVWMWTSATSGKDRVLMLQRKEPGTQDRIIASLWRPFQFPWDAISWWLGVVLFLGGIYWLVRLNLTRIFLLDLTMPPASRNRTSGWSAASLISDLPINLLIIAPESCPQVASLIRRPDVQVHDAEELLQPVAALASPTNWTQTSSSVISPTNRIVRDRRPLVLRNFSYLPDDDESWGKIIAALVKVVSELNNSVVIISDVDPVFNPSLEANKRLRALLRNFVRIDLNSHALQELDEEDADYQNRVSANSYYGWLVSGMTKPEKLVLLQLAQEAAVNPNSRELVSQLMRQQMIGRRWGVLTVKDQGLANFLKHGIPHRTVKHWEKQIGGTRAGSLQTALLVLGVGVVAFLVYTQGEIFNTWVTYATGLAASIPKVLQLVDSVRGKYGVKG